MDTSVNQVPNTPLPPTEITPTRRVLPVKTILLGVGSFILLAVVTIGVLYVANPRKLADIRSLAGKNNAFSQGGKWKIEEGCKGSGCVHDASVNEARNAIHEINSGAQSATVTLPNGTVQTVTNGTQAMEALKTTYEQIHDRAPNVDFPNVAVNPQNLALPYVAGGYTLEELKAFYAGVDYTKPENFNRAGYAQLGAQNGDPVAGYYFQSNHYYPVETSNTKNEKETATNPTEPPPQCVSIVAYQNGNALSITELSALHVGDTITLAFAPGGAATKVRFAVNPSTPPVDSDWHETTTRSQTNPGQFVWGYQLENTANFNIIAQWFDGTNWN